MIGDGREFLTSRNRSQLLKRQKKKRKPENQESNTRPFGRFPAKETQSGWLALVKISKKTIPLRHHCAPSRSPMSNPWATITL